MLRAFHFSAALLITVLALSLTMTATSGRAADYEIFADFTTVATGVNHYSVERLDHKNKKLHHCTAVLDAKQPVNAPKDPAMPRVRPVKNENWRERCQTCLAGCPCSAPGKSIKQREKLSSVFHTLLGVWT